MRQPRWLGGFGVAALLLAAGCEDLPTTVTVASSPSPSASPSASPSGSPSGSPSPSASPSKSPSPSPTGTPTPRPTVTPTPRPTEHGATPTPAPTATTNSGGGTSTPSASPQITAPARVVMDAPDSTVDFTKNPLTVTLRAELPFGVTLKELQVLYEDVVIYRQVSPALTFSTSTWNPNVLKGVTSDSVSTPMTFGEHHLKGRAITTAGTASETPVLTFFKPLLFKDWITRTTTNGTQVTVPPLPIARSGVKLHAVDNRLFAVFGKKQDGTPADTILAMGLDGFPLGWGLHSSPGLTWRQGFALASAGRRFYIAGGRPQGDAGPADPTASVQAFAVYDHATTNLPDLPQAVSDASAIVLDHFLYVIGGTTTGAAADATNKVFRIALTTDDTPAANASWEERASLPQPLRGTVAVVGNGRLFLMGGQAVDGSRRENIYAYDASGDSWTLVQLLPGAVSDGTAVELGRAIWYIGGRGGDGAPSKATFRFDYDNQDLRTRAFPPGAPNLPVERSQPAAAVVEDIDGGNTRRRLFLLGGDHLDADQLVPAPEVLLGDTL